VNASSLRPTFRDQLVERVESRRASLFEAASHLLRVDGKAIRPRCVQLIARLGGDEPLEAHERLAEAVEILHVGSLIHDDILDEAEVRRGVEAVHARFGNKAAVLAGDFLLSRSCGLIAGLGVQALNLRMAEVLSGLCEGEFQQDEQRYRLDVTLEEYLERVALKTSGPFELACEGAALLSGHAPDQVQQARRFGYHLGRLFQMYDDLLDFSASAVTAGKPVGQDLLAGQLTLPVILTLRHPERGPRLRALLDPYPVELTPELSAILTDPAVLADTAAALVREAEMARRCLEVYPSSPVRSELEAYLDRMVEAARMVGGENSLVTVELAPHGV